MTRFGSILSAFLLLATCSPGFSQPANDDCAAPQNVTVPFSGGFDTTGATPTASLLTCPNFGEDVWFSVVSPIDGLLAVSHDFNPNQHAVYHLPGGVGCPTDLDLLYCDSPTNQNQSFTPAVAGETYLVRIGSWQGGDATGVLDVDVLPPPANDLCTNPEVLSVPAGVLYDATGATPTPGLNCPVNRDIWFEITPTSAGLITLNANANQDPANFGVDVAVYVSFGAGTCPTNADEVLCDGTTTASFDALAGVTYLIRVGFPFGDAFAAGGLLITQTTGVPANDDCTTAEPLTLPASFMVSTVAATPDVNALTCDLNDDIWYQVTAPGTGQLQVQLSGGNFRHQVFDQSAGPGTCPTDFDQIGGCWSINQSWSDVVAGQSYLIRIGQGQPGPISGGLNVDFVPSLVNDDCTSAEQITIPSTVSVTTLGATPDFGLGCLSNPDSWYRFTAPTSGLLHLEFDDFLSFAVYESPQVCPTASDEIACDDEVEALVPVTAGTQYFLRISGFNSTPPVDTNLSLEILSPATHDDCAGGAATLINVPTTTPVTWDNLTASDDLNNFGCNVRRDLWYRFVAPDSGCVRFENSTQGMYAAYYDSSGGTGCPISTDEIICYQSLPFPQAFEFDVLVGESYLIRVGGFGTNPIAGEFTVEYILGPPDNVVCDNSVTDEITVSYTVPANANYDLGAELRLNGVLIATLPQGQTSFTQALPPGFVGVLQAGVTGLSSTLGASEEVTCAVAFGGSVNDDCVNAISIGVGTHPFDSTVAALDPTADLAVCSAFSTPTSDVWFEFTAPGTELYTVSLCNASFDTGLEVWQGTLGCPSPGDMALECTFGGTCSLSFFGNAGETYYIRILGYDFVGGMSTLEIAADCSALMGLTCDYDCFTNVVSLSWSGGLHDSYDLISDVGVLTSGFVGDTFDIVSPTPGFRTYTVVGNCPNGTSMSAECVLFVPDTAPPGTDLILALEGALTGGMLGVNDSATALRDALLANGRTVSILGLADFEQYPCLTPFTDAAENIWVLLGTSPNFYRLSAGEGDLLGTLAAAGTRIYLEGADHWGSNHVSSLLDERDGIEPDGAFNNIPGGDDSFTTMVGQDSGLANGDFTGFGQIGYQQDNFTIESTDQLVVSGTDTTGTYPPDPNIAADAIWINVDDSGNGELPYVTGVHAVHTGDGGVMISCSFEFGGFGGDRNLLAASYLAALAGGANASMFVRGDVNGDNAINIADAVYLLLNLFPNGVPNPLPCLESADGNNDGSVNLSDVIAILGSQFGFPPAPLPAPYPNCGTEADSPNQTGIGCFQSTCP